MVLDHPNDSNSSRSSDEVQQICVVDENPVDEHVDVVALNLAIVPYHPPVIDLDPIQLGMVKVFYGPVPPPDMLWARFDT